MRNIRTSILATFSRVPQSVRRIRTLVPLALVLLLILGTAALLGTIAFQRANTQAAALPPGHAVLVSRADYHSETLLNGQDLEMNLAISQVADDCQAPLSGGYCLRYSVVLQEKAVMVGYGVIPAKDVKVTASSITIKLDTRKVPNFVQVVGTGGPINISWKTANTASTVSAAMLNKPQKATAQGGISTYAFPNSGAIATIIYK